MTTFVGTTKNNSSPPSQGEPPMAGAVTVSIDLPAAPGTPVYVVEPCYCTSFYKTRCRLLAGQGTANRKAIVVVPAEGRKNKACCLKLYIRPFDPVKHMAGWGASVFECSEKALEYINKIKERKL